MVWPGDKPAKHCLGMRLKQLYTLYIVWLVNKVKPVSSQRVREGLTFRFRNAGNLHKQK